MSPPLLPPLPPITPRQFIDSASCMFKLDATRLCGLTKVVVGEWKFCAAQDGGAVDTMKKTGKLT